MNSRIPKEIQQLLDLGDNSLEDYPHSQWLYERIAELQRMRKYIKVLKKMKSNSDIDNIIFCFGESSIVRLP